MKTVYLIFQIRNQARNLDLIKLYAYTTKKKLLNDFIENRDMSLFRVEEKEVTDTDFTQFQIIHAKERLTTMHFETLDIINGKRKTKNVSVTGPVYEEEFIFLNSDKIMNEIAKTTISTAKFLKDEYIRALQFFHYFEFDAYKSERAEFDSFYSGFNFDCDDDSLYGFPITEHLYFNCKYDQLSLFIYFYGQTLKVKE